MKDEKACEILKAIVSSKLLAGVRGTSMKGIVTSQVSSDGTGGGESERALNNFVGRAGRTCE